MSAGARDLGGIVPKDEVNPDYHHLQLSELTTLLTNAGWELRPRLPVYPDLLKAILQIADVKSARKMANLVDWQRNRL